MNNTNMGVLGAGVRETIRQIFQLNTMARIKVFTRSIVRSVLSRKKDSTDSSGESGGPHVGEHNHRDIVEDKI